MKYIENIDEKFVQDFAVKFFKEYFKSEKVSVSRGLNCWQIVGYVEKDVKYPHDVSIALYDFGAYSRNTYALAQAGKAWQVALYKKFGDAYLKDLKEDMSAQIIKEMKKKMKEVDAKIEKIKNGKDRTL